MTEDQTVTPTPLDNVPDQSHDPSADVQMEDPVTNDTESQVANSDVVTLPKMGEPQNSPDITSILFSIPNISTYTVYRDL